ncbi:hypothetical protein CWO91_15440 [Bradyrhizobium genosp. SA-3]|uniref:hypothetical protein n=1 Tax=Bradyrhizobium genosp. SA-3 TaxID=508868 RepID=UPI001028B003|nr:hypothetical protein [Bradyrhizobium genosp. SA-3]RZN09935.1 hypothetical protein CWO91_15440 [Bradyrhizobium genosp. SA-3]
MMSFYKKLGLQFVIGAPFEKRVAVLEHMDTIVEVKESAFRCFNQNLRRRHTGEPGRPATLRSSSR